MNRYSVWAALISILMSAAHADSFAPDGAFSQVQSETKQYENSVRDERSSYEEGVLREWRDYQAKVEREWKDGALPERRVYVEYTRDLSTRVRIDYQSGTVTVESLQPTRSQESSERAKASIEGLLRKAMGPGQGKAGPVLDPEILGGQTAGVLVQRATPVGLEVGTDGVSRERFEVSFKLVPNHMSIRARRVAPFVQKWAEKNRLDPALIYAVIRQESAFNPRARSWVPAFGLMQVVPHAAGREVLEKITGKDVVPDEETLYDPESNVMIGSSYLKLLRDEHFGGVKNLLNRTYLVICSYNWGPTRLQRAIARGGLNPEEEPTSFFSDLRRIVPMETKDYLTRVNQFRLQFAADRGL